MSDTPTLVTEPPLPLAQFPLRGATLRIGSAADAPIRIDHPLVELRHAMLLEREDGWWIAASGDRVHVNGVPLQGEQRLRHGDRLLLGAGAVLRFDSGVVDTPVKKLTATKPVLARKRRRWRVPRLGMPSFKWRSAAPFIAILFVFAVAGGFAWFAWRTWGTRPVDVAVVAPLTVPQATQFDSLLTIAYDHIERGQVLVEYGANSAALDEFASGIAAITTSALRNVPYVRERVEALRASVADIYRSRNLSVPGTYASARRTVSLATSGLRAALTVEQFAAGFAAVQALFATRYGSSLFVTGSDHPEHLSLYGAGGAIDVRSTTLRPEQVQFVVDAARTKGIRVKDFSQDAILRAQIAAAMKAGLAGRAGTGLHLHIDRFANRRDAYTVP